MLYDQRVEHRARRRRGRDRRVGAIALVALLATACGGADAPRTQTPVAEATPPEPAPSPEPPPPPPSAGLNGLSCPTTKPASRPLPRMTTAHETLEYWEGVLGARFNLDEPLLSREQIANANAALEVPRPGFYAPRDLLAPFPEEQVRTKVSGRMEWLRNKFESGDYLPDADIGAALAIPAFEVGVELRVATEPVQMYCVPSERPMRGKDSIDPRIDRNRCSSVRAQEPVAILATWPNGMKLAQSALSWGFLPADAPLSPPLSDEFARAFAHGPFAQLPEGHAELGVPARARVPRLGTGKRRGGKLVIATGEGFETVAARSLLSVADNQALTRRAVLREAFAYLGSPYGYGGKDGGLDCSRFLIEVFAAFGLELPRHSSWQPKAVSFSVDVAGIPRSDKLGLLDAAQRRGVVLLQLDGHIMLYLGRDARDRPMVMHAFAHYLETCPNGGETAVLADRIEVSDLMLGDGTSKTSFLDRIATISVIGKSPDSQLAGAATDRLAAPLARPSKAECRRARGSRIFVGPRVPTSGQRLRAVAHMASSRGPETLALFDPKGQRVDAAVVRTGGPPYGFIATVDAPATGTWTIALGEGSSLRSCRTVRVLSRRRAQALHSKRRARTAAVVRDALEARKAAAAGGDDVPGAPEPMTGNEAAMATPPTAPPPTASPAEPPPPPPPAADAVWRARRDWDRSYEDLYAVFVERLFDYPVDQDLTWPNLHTLLRDADRNFLYGYNGDDEESVLELVPDCADLPYTLRAYFSWKLGLPFGVHDCGRARRGRPPTCERYGDNGISRTEIPVSGRRRDDSDAGAFKSFVDRVVRRTVHSSSGRTVPDDDNTDFYPVGLSRRSLRPGVVFNDPYGHLIVIAEWIPQEATGYGALIGADAQPDGTIGRRRFWRGSFLFKPDTDNGGAGFKAFRPWIRDRESGGLRLATNEELAERRYRNGPRYSEIQYDGTVNRFYDRMRALINPRPLNPTTRMLSLVEALEEQVARRVVSVNNGEAFMKERQFAAIDMPDGARIFQTSGPWEEFSTPSRDWRLLIAVDTVNDFPGSVERNPEQYGLAPSQGASKARELGAALDAELRKRTFEYVRSDGSKQTLSLADVVARAQALEMAYNPNDCIEVRWAAPEGSAERSTCRRAAPDDQRAKMSEYREWFSNRSRPPS